MRTAHALFFAAVTTAVSAFAPACPSARPIAAQSAAVARAQSWPQHRSSSWLGRSSSALFLSVEEQEDGFLARAVDAGAGSPVAAEDVVYIIMYNPNEPMEGIHTVNYPRGQDKLDILLAFEDMDDAVSFAQNIRADPKNENGEPVASPMSLAQCQQACAGMQLPMKLVPKAAVH